MPLKLGHYYLVTNPETPVSEISGLMLDANFVGNFYDWFLATNPDSETTKDLLPILQLIREKRLIHWQYGALERSWAWQDVKEVNSQNYSRINPHLFRRIGHAVETILYATDKDFSLWTSENRDFSIPFSKETKSSPVNEPLTKEEAKALFQVVAPAWIASLVLMEFQSKITSSLSIEELTELFLEWRGAVRSTGAPDTSEAVLIGELFFFGGSITGFYYEDNYLGKSKEFPIFDAAKLLKLDSWESIGKAKIARNIAFDLALLHLQHLFRFGLRQGENSIVRVRPEKMAIVTGDKGMAVIAQQFGPAFEVLNSLPGRIHIHPANSRFRLERPVEDLLLLSKFPHRPPQDLPRQDELGKPLEELIQRSK
jgi:hypothetical protein